MVDDDKVRVPENPNEVVIPIGQAKLVTTKEECDEALETAGRIFREKEDQDMTVLDELERAAKRFNAEEELSNAEKEVAKIEKEEGLKVLSDKELAALKPSRYGRDKYGRSLNKDGTPRKGRADKGMERGEYKPREKSE